jgi:hypothetical protein
MRRHVSLIGRSLLVVPPTLKATSKRLLSSWPRPTDAGGTR